MPIECNLVVNICPVFWLIVNFDLRALVRMGTINYILCIEKKNHDL